MIEHLDGELIVGSATHPDVLDRTKSVVMSYDKPIDDLAYHVFDWTMNPDMPFIDRLDNALRFDVVDNIVGVHHFMVGSLDELLAFEHRCVSAGYEGVIIRSIRGQYKFGKATVREATLGKLKRFTDTEALISGFEEEMENLNDKETNALGLSERKHKKENKIPKGRLGAFRCRKHFEGWPEPVEFSVGSGLKADQRVRYWEDRADLLNANVKFKYQGLTKEGVPRFPTFIEIRPQLDMLDD